MLHIRVNMNIDQRENFQEHMEQSIVVTVCL